MADEAQTEDSSGTGGEAQSNESFEADLEKLEQIVQKLEDGNLALEESLELYEEGIRAYRRCQKTLSEAEVEVRKLVETVEGELEEESFEPPR